MHFSELDILFEGKYLLAINKPAGIVVEDTMHKYTLQTVALDYLKSKDKWPWKCFVGVPHRLDRPVTGVVLFTKKRGALKVLVDMFRKREISKTYYAVVEGRPAQDDIELAHWHRKNDELRKAELFDEEKSGCNVARLRYKIIEEKDGKCLLEVKLITGKFHQIRAQLSRIGHPIVGDKLYGSTQEYTEFGIALHARRLALKHPVTGADMSITAPFPKNKLWREFKLPATPEQPH